MRHAVSLAAFVCLGLTSILFAPGCAVAKGPSLASPTNVSPGAPDLAEDEAEPPSEDEQALGEAPLTDGDEVMTFDGMDAEPGAPEQIRAAPRREPIGRFKLFGEGPG